MSKKRKPPAVTGVRSNLNRCLDIKNALLGGGYDLTEPARDNITDILADLRHYSDSVAVDFHEALDRSYDHYTCELADDKR